MNPKELNEDRLSLVRKYLREIVIVLSWVIIYFLHRDYIASKDEMQRRSDLQIEEDKKERKQRDEADEIIRRYEKQVEILRPENPESFSNDKTDKHAKSDH